MAPRTISFTGAMQTLEAFQLLLEFGAAQDAASRLRLYHDLLDAIATHRVGDRPDRYKPWLKQRRRNNYDWLTKPRAEIKRKMAKGVTENQVPFVLSDPTRATSVCAAFCREPFLRRNPSLRNRGGRAVLPLSEAGFRHGEGRAPGSGLGR